MNKKVKKYLKRSFRVLLIFLLFLIVGGYTIFKSSYVQTYITNEIGDYLSKKTEFDISVQEVDFRPFSTVILKGLLILDHHQDTMLYSGSFSIDITDYDLDNKEINLAFLELEHAHLNIIKYEEEQKDNLSIFIDKLTQDDDDKEVKQDSTKWNFLVENLVFEDLNFTYWDYNHIMKYKGIDFNHLVIKNGAASVNHVLVVDDSFMAGFEHLSFEEKSGFVLSDYHGNFKMDNNSMLFRKLNLVTPSTNIKGNLEFSYDNLGDLSHFIQKVKLDSRLDNCELALEDIAYFAPELTGIKEKVKISADVKGKLSKLKVKNCDLRYRNHSSFKGDVEIEGIPDMKNAFIYVKVKALETNNEDISKIPLYPFYRNKTVKTPTWFRNFGDIVFNGSFTGFLSDFVAYGNFSSACGLAKADVELLQDSTGNTVIKGTINSNKFNLRRLSGTSALGQVSASGKLNAQFNKEDFLVNFNGDVPLFDFLDYRYRGIKMDGKVDKHKFSGAFDIKDTNLVMNFNGDINFSKSQQQYKFNADIARANMHNIHWVDRDSSTSISGKVNINLTGKQIEDINGKLELNNFEWSEKGELYHLDYLVLKSLKRNDKEMMLLKSDLFSGKIEGNYDIQEIYPSFINILSKDMPSIVNWKYSPHHSKGNNKFKMMFKLRDYTPIHDLFTPGINFIGPTQFSGSFDDKKQEYYMNFASDTLRIGERNFAKVKLFTHNRDSNLYLKTSVQFAQLFDTVGLENLNLKTRMEKNLLKFDVAWKNNYDFVSKATIDGQLDLNNLDSILLHVDDAEIDYKATEWKVDQKNKVVIQKDKVTLSDFNFSSKDQKLNIGGVIGKQPTDLLVLDMDNFKMANLQYFFSMATLDIDGVATGKLSVKSALENPLIDSDIDVLKMKLNNQKFGKVRLNSQYFAADKRLAVGLTADKLNAFDTIKALTIKGDYFPSRIENQLDLIASFRNVKLQFLEKYFEGLFSDFGRGKVGGEVKIKGTLARPEMYGVLEARQLSFKLDYLNVSYLAENQKIHFDKEHIRFKDFVLTHRNYKDSKGVLNGYVSHKGFKDIKYNFSEVKLSEMFALNTTSRENETYFGKAFVDGNIYLRGDGKDNYLGGRLKTVTYNDKERSESCQLTLPLNESNEVELSDFIHFVSLKDTNQANNDNAFEEEIDISGLHLDFDFDITSSTNVKIVFDPTVGDEIKVRGDGQLNLQINNDGKFLMNGDYVVQRGEYYFNLRNLIGRRFSVKQGSKISWDGDPANANLDITTYYSANAPLSGLIDTSNSQNLDRFAQFDNTRQVHANLFLKGSLWEPLIGMGVSLPNATAEEEDLLSEKLITEEQVSEQVFSLLLTGRFSGASGINAGLDDGIQVVEGQINNSLSGLIDGLDLGVDYNQRSSAVDTSANDELRLLVGFQYKKFSLKTNVDIANSVGDIQADYRITNTTRLKAYSKIESDLRDGGTNTSTNNTTTTGVGILYQKSFNSFRDLFKGAAKTSDPPKTKKTGS